MKCSLVRQRKESSSLFEEDQKVASLPGQL